LADLQQTVHPHKWLPVSCRSSAGQGKFAGQRSIMGKWCTVALVICKLQHILKGFTSLVAQRVFTSMMRIMQPANRGLACRIPCCRSQSGLFSALAVNVREAHEYMRAIQPCNTHLYCTVVTSWHCVLHHKLATNK